MVYGALVLLALIWGYTWVAIKIATNDASPLLVASGRIALGVAVLFAILAATRRSLRPTPLGPTIVLGLLQTTGWTVLQTIAVSLGGAGKVAILGYTMPFWVALIAWPFLGERIAGARWIALALAAAGLALVVSPLGPRTITGDLLAVGAGFLWACSAVYLKWMRARHDVDLLSLTAWQMLWGVVPMLALTAIVPQHVRVTPSFVAAMLFAAVLGAAVAWYLWMFVLSHLPAGVAGIASLATPVVGVAASALQLHEIPSPAEIGGMALIVIALVVNAFPASASLPQRKATATAARHL